MGLRDLYARAIHGVVDLRRAVEAGRARGRVDQVRARNSKPLSGGAGRTCTRVLQSGLHPDTEQPVVLVAGRRRRIDVAWLALRVGIECHG